MVVKILLGLECSRVLRPEKTWSPKIWLKITKSVRRTESCQNVNMLVTLIFLNLSVHTFVTENTAVPGTDSEEGRQPSKDELANTCRPLKTFSHSPLLRELTGPTWRDLGERAWERWAAAEPRETQLTLTLHKRKMKRSQGRPFLLLGKNLGQPKFHSY